MRVLLTGGAGYIGSHTYVALVEAGYRAVILDNFSNSKRDILHRLQQITGHPVPLVNADVLDADAIKGALADHSIDAVIHFAAKKSVPESNRTPLDYMQSNIGGLVTLMRAMEQAGVFRLVFSSSAAVYGHATKLPTPETAPVSYANPYGYSKLVCEQIIDQVARLNSDWRIGVLRYFNPVGAHPSGLIGEDPDGVPDNLVPYLAKVAIGELDKISVFGGDFPTPDGTGIRDFIHVCDLASGHLASLKALENGGGHVVNLGTGRGHSVLDMIAAYARACGKDLPYEIVARRPGDPAESCADTEKAKALLGFETRFDLDDMCTSSWKWMQTHLKSRPQDD